MGTYILNKHQVVKFKLDPKFYNVLIRITSPNEDFLILDDDSFYREIMELKFYDFTGETNGLAIFSDEHLERIVTFFEKHKFCENLVVHCDLGISRSAGIAIGWFLFKDDRASIYKIYHGKKHLPNRHIVEKFAKHFKKSVKYIDKWEKENIS